MGDDDSASYDPARLVTMETFKPGLRVVRGPSFSKTSTVDGGEGKLGTLVCIRLPPNVNVRWDANPSELRQHRIGGGKHDLMFAEEPGVCLEIIVLFIQCTILWTC